MFSHRLVREYSMLMLRNGAAGAMAARRPVAKEEVSTNDPSPVDEDGKWHDGISGWFSENGVDPRALAAEFMGTFLFQFLGASVASNSVDAGLTTAAMGNGCALAVMIYSTARVSGGHLNPAISTAFLLVGEGNMTVPKWSMYLCSQFSGALLAASSLRWLLPDTAVVRNPFVTQGILNEGVSRNLAGLGIFEFILTFALTFVVCAVMLDAKGPARQYAPLAIGFMYAAGVYCEGPYTGGSMNPARTLAAAIVYADFTGMWITLLCIFLGAIFGAFAYKSAFNVQRNEDTATALPDRVSHGFV
jgi:aquaporin NIP